MTNINNSTSSSQLQQQPTMGIQPNDPKKLVDYLMSDFRSLSMDAKKKHNHVKEAAESGLVKIRNISATCEQQQDSDLIQALRISCTELLHPFLLGCSSKSPRLVPISLQAIQRLIHNRVIDSNVVPAIVNELWILTEAECEELKIIQTITPFVGTEPFVSNWALSKCIVLTFRLNASKDSLVINAASAAVRQLFSCVFERVIKEDEAPEIQQQQQTLSNQQQSLAPPSLRPCAADAFLLLRDLCALIRREQPNWLIGLQRIAPILGLELLESVIKNYPSIFLKHQEFAELLKTQISAQIAAKMLHVGEREFAMLAVAAANATQTNNGDNQNKPLSVSAALLNQQLQQQSSSHLTSTSQMAKSAASSSVSSTGRDFPIVIRSLRISLALVINYHSLLGAQSEAIIHFLIELLAQHATTSWEAAVAIEVLHKMLAQPKLLSWLCTRPDGPKFLEAIVFSRLFAFIKKCLDEASHDGFTMRDGENNIQSGFVYKGVFLPLGDGHPSSKRSILLDWLDKHNAEKIPEAYCLSVTYATFCVASRSLHSAIEDFQNNENDSSEYSENAKELYNSSYHFLVAGLSTLLECSVDDSLNEQLLNCLCSLAILALRLQLPKPRREVLKAICRAALPFQYYNKFIDSIGTSTTANGTIGSNVSSSNFTPFDDSSTTFDNQKEHNILAMGTVCPSPDLPPQFFNTSVMLTAKNLQVLRILVNLAINNGSQFADCWEMTLTTLQHFVWIIGLRPSPTGSFRSGMSELSSTSAIVSPVAEANSNALSSTTTTNASAAAGVLGSNTVILTTMASSELPDINQQLVSLFDSTSKLDEVSLHHVIAALCKLSNETMTVAQHSLRETSFFSIAKLQQAALVNLPRLHVFWRPVTAHLLDLCSHSNNNIREWGSISLTRLVEEAMKQVVGGLISDGQEEITKREQLILSPLCSMNEITFSDVRAKQLDCLMKILQADNRTLETPLWPFIVQIVRSVVATDTQIRVDPQLIDQGFRALSLMVKEFLSVLPFECVEMLVETNALYGQQQLHLNVSLASIGQLWDISDFVRRETSHGKISAEVDQQQIWLLIYQALGNLCSDPRPPVRKSACDTLLQTVAAHGQALNIKCWEQMLIEILFPMLCRVHQCAQTASTQRSNTTNSLGAPNLMIHHSRDTESKQWAETSVKTLGGVVKIFNAHRPSLLQLENFSDCWNQLLRHIVLSARTDSAEISLSAVKNFQELLFGRQQQTNSESSSIFQIGNKSPSTPGGIKSKQQQCSLIDSLDLSLSPSLPDPLWMSAWNNWLQIARSILASDCCETTDDAFLSSTSDVDSGYSKSVVLPSTKKSYVPSLYHLSTLLETFIWLFQRVRQQVPVDDIRLQCLGQIFIDIATVPISSDQIPISTLFSNRAKNGSEQHLPLNMAQEYLFSCTRSILQEQINTKNVNSGLRAALPDMLRLLILWMQLSWKRPLIKFIIDKSSKSDNENIVNNSNLITFGETSMKMLLEFYSKTAAFEEVVQHTILVEIVKTLGEPLSLKYLCPSQSTWQLAAATLNKICQIGIPIARENVNLFKQLWPCISSVVDNFLFSTSKSSKLLNADERKRHEFVDCLLVELLRAELLPFANKLPRDFMILIIDILNRGSINTIDANDVLDLHEQRTDLSRVCFDALLSLSQMEEETKPISSSFFSSSSPVHRTDGGFLRNTTSQSHRQAVGSVGNSSSSLGATAISSLLNRCKHVLNCFARDEQRCGGHFPPLPQERVFEAISALRAVSALIDGFSRNPTTVLYSHLVTLHPNLVQLIPSSRCDQQLELALMTCLNSYQTLLLLNLHINENK